MSDLNEIKKYKMLVESAIVESYEDRVLKVVNAIVNRFQTGTVNSKEELLGAINSALEYMDIPDAKAISSIGKKSTARKDFIKDVLAGLKGKIRISRASSEPKISKTDKIKKLSKLVQAAVGDSFPDGDPIDMIILKAPKFGLDSDFIRSNNNLDKAAKLLGSKSYNDYLADLWDQIKADNPNFPGIQDNNPWR